MKQTRQAQKNFTRREAIQTGLATGLAGIFAQSCAPAVTPSHTVAKPIRNVILLVSDGMSAGVPTMAHAFSHLVRNKSSAWFDLQRTPTMPFAVGQMDTSSLNSLVTDSAAAATAWASGSHVFNRALNTLPDGRALTPLGILAKEAGKTLGLVSTTRITHATPAGFATAVTNRDEEDAIAVQFLERGVDLLLGGGTRHFSPSTRKDQRDLLAEFKAAGYQTVASRAELASAPQGKLLGTFWPSHIPYFIDRHFSPDSYKDVPGLAEMTQLALSRLSTAPHGFFLMVEAGRVDHAAHANDVAAILWDQLEFDDTARFCVDWAVPRGDTMVFITTDHGNSNPGLNGMGKNYSESTECFRRIANIKQSFEAMGDFLKGTLTPKNVQPTADAILSTVQKATGITLSKEEVLALAAAWDKTSKPTTWSTQYQNVQGLLGLIMANHTGVGWCGTAHTSDLVPIFSLGPQTCFNQGEIFPNTKLYDILTKGCMGIEHTNPSMTPAQAASFQPEPPLDTEPHWLGFPT